MVPSRDSNSTHRFGGNWTDTKLRAVSSYLVEYRRIFDRNPAAKFLRTTYVDGFAGTGDRVDSVSASLDDSKQVSLFAGDAMSVPISEVRKRGSVRMALELSTQFNEYLFVEKKKSRAQDLERLIHAEYPLLEGLCHVKHGDANSVLSDWCISTNWSKNRAVVFLDPYGMTVEWSTIKCIADTNAIDLWLLFPLGMGLNRLLTRGGRPPTNWCDKLTRILGTKSWEEAFYKDVPSSSLFEQEVRSVTVKVATFATMKKFVHDRLASTFSAVAPSALTLFNTKRHPMYMLYFAAGNKKGANPAIRIAEHLIRKLANE